MMPPIRTRLLTLTEVRSALRHLAGNLYGIRSLDRLAPWRVRSLGDRGDEQMASSIRIPNTFATVDHPFHASRAETLRRSLADGVMLRWIGSHQGGYPVEFYPLGAAWLEVIVWALLLGSLPMMAMHKLVVISVFVLPALGFCALARGDRLPLGIGFLALVMHVSVRGWWWSGGYMELIEWGLLTNVASAAVLPLVIVALYRCISNAKRGVGECWLPQLHRWPCTPMSARSFRWRQSLPECSCRSTVWTSDHVGALKAAARPTAGVAALALLLLAPLVIPLVRFGDQYVFVRYSEYEDLAAFWDSTVRAVSSPVLAMAIVGAVFAIAIRRDPLARTVVVVLGLYIAGTLAVGHHDGVRRPCEPTRSDSPDAVSTAAGDLFGRLRGILRDRRRSAKTAPEALQLSREFALIVLATSFWPRICSTGFRECLRATRHQRQSLRPAMPRSAHWKPRSPLPAIRHHRARRFWCWAPVVSWHDQLWAPQWSDRRFFYDDWLWYWQTDHVGDYDPERSHAYDNDSSTLSLDYLRQHAIGAVVVTGDAADDAAASPLLNRIGTRHLRHLPRRRSPGGHRLGTRAGRMSPSSPTIHIDGLATSSSTDYLVHHNWYPRWQASVDGGAASITEGRCRLHGSYRAAARDGGRAPIRRRSMGLAGKGAVRVGIRSRWSHRWPGHESADIGVPQGCADPEPDAESKSKAPTSRHGGLSSHVAQGRVSCWCFCYTQGSMGTSMIVGRLRSAAHRIS